MLETVSSRAPPLATAVHIANHLPLVIMLFDFVSTLVRIDVKTDVLLAGLRGDWRHAGDEHNYEHTDASRARRCSTRGTSAALEGVEATRPVEGHERGRGRPDHAARHDTG